MILILMVDGARAVISFCIRSAIPGYMVVPPDMTVLAYRSLRMSTSHFMMELYVVSWIPQDSIPKKDGWKRASGARKRSLPTAAASTSLDTAGFHSQEGWLEEGFWGTES